MGRKKSDSVGMFDYVCIKVICPVCGKEITDFQTKDTDCTMDYLLPGESKANPKIRYLDTYAYCEHEYITAERFGQTDDFCANSVWIDVMIPVNKNGVLSKDTRKYKVHSEERFWNAKEMAEARYPTDTIEPSKEVTKRNKTIKKLRDGGPYKPIVTIDTDLYTGHVLAMTNYYKQLIGEMGEKQKAVDIYCRERKVTPTCNNCINKKDGRCHFIENIPGINIDFTNDLPESRTCCEWKEKDIKTEW